MSTNENNGISAVTTSQTSQAHSPQTTQAAVNALSQSNSGGDSLICQWQNCGERTTTAEALYVSFGRLVLLAAKTARLPRAAFLPAYIFNHFIIFIA
jgi:hypothetical protein